MVRILEIKELAEKKKELVARSEIHRQTLALEVTNLKLGVALVKKRMHGLRAVYRILGWTVPIGGLVFGRKQKSGGAGFISQFLSGFNLASRLKSLFGGHKAEEPESQTEEAKKQARFE
jgi:hypothetical protein